MFQLHLGLGDVNGIAFDHGAQRLFVLNGAPSRSTFMRFDSHTQEFRQILPSISGVDLDYSRDGHWIAYTTSQESALWISRADGSAARQLTFSPEMVQLPRWSPDGKQVAYMSKTPDRPWRIFIQRLDNGQRREASEGNDNQGAPTWSPDGRFLAYGNVMCQPTHSCAIHRIDLSTGKVQTLPGSEGLFTARWSPDGRYVSALDSERHQLFLFDVATQKWRKLADSENGTDLNWSADSIYLYADIPGADARILRIRVADGHQETAADLRSQDIFTLAEVDNMDFSLSPDGSVILHRRTHSSEIYAYDVRDQ
jgi:Tol biopolymer transport system component